MSKLKELKTEATQLGVTFSPNIGEAKLAQKIEEKYLSQETGEAEVLATIKAKESMSTQVAAGEWTDLDRRKLAKKREAEARKTRIVTIIDNDSRVNNQTTTAMADCSCEAFDLGQIALPLNVEVEVSQGHIDGLKCVEIIHHIKDPITGVSKDSTIKRYTVAYSDKQPT